MSWKGESVRHSLARKRIRTAERAGRRANEIVKRAMVNIEKRAEKRMGDRDKDGYPDMLDCAPNDRKKHSLLGVFFAGAGGAMTANMLFDMMKGQKSPTREDIGKRIDKLKREIKKEKEKVG